MKTKTLLTLLMWGAYSISYKLFSPVLTNSVAITQLESTEGSFVDYQLYQGTWEYYVPAVLILFTLLLFRNNIRNLYMKHKSKLL